MPWKMDKRFNLILLIKISNKELSTFDLFWMKAMKIGNYSLNVVKIILHIVEVDLGKLVSTNL